MDIKQQLINIFNTLQLIEVKGQNVMILGQCMSQMGQLINYLSNEQSKDTEENNVDKIK